MKLLVSLLLFSLMADLCWSDCHTNTHWSITFDRQGWSNCGSSHGYITGFYRGPYGGKSDHLYLLEKVMCCKASEPYEDLGSDTTEANWWDTLDSNYRWALCPTGYFLHGLYRSKGLWLYNIEKASCWKPDQLPEKYGDCVDKDIPLFNMQGWESCDDGYYMVGFYKSSCNYLHCIDTLRCCKMYAYDACGGTLNSYKGTITSPNHPGKYPPFSYCTWSFNLRDTVRVDIKFSDFELESDHHCPFDVVKIFKSSGSETWCGGSLPKPLEVSSAGLKIHFKSDKSVEKTGFKLTYQVECGQTLRSSSGIITSPNYPSEYPDNAECEWSFYSKQGYVKLTISDFQLEKSYDKVKIYLFSGLEPLTLSGQHDGLTQMGPAATTRIHFKSDGSVGKKGFKIEYQTISG